MVFLSQRDYERHYTALPLGRAVRFFQEFRALLCHYDVVSSDVSRVIECISLILLYKYCIRPFFKCAHGFFMLSPGECIYVNVYVYICIYMYV